MDAIDISVSGVVFGLLLVVPSMLLVWKFRLGFNKRLIISVARMLVQLGFVAVYLKYIFLFDNAFVNIAYVCMMVFFAAFSGIKNSGLRLKKLLFQTVVSMLIPTMFTLLYFNFAVVQLDNIFKADMLIPIGGLMLGNILKSNIVALKTFFNSARKEENTYFYLLAAGATKTEAAHPFLKEAIRMAMAPNIASMATVGLVSLPGVMTGQILGGADPVLSVKYQVMVMIVIFATALFSNLIQLLFAVRYGFDEHDKLKKELLSK